MKLWGVLGANDTTTDDGSATFATDINSNLLVGVALHELTHAMGRVPYGQPYGSQPDIFDLFRFTSPGTQLIDGHNTAAGRLFLHRWRQYEIGRLRPEFRSQRFPQ